MIIKKYCGSSCSSSSSSSDSSSSSSREFVTELWILRGYFRDKKMIGRRKDIDETEGDR